MARDFTVFVMKTKTLAIFGIIVGLYLAHAFIPFSSDLPLIDFILAYFRPYFGWKRTIQLRLGFLTVPFVLRFPDVWGFILSLDYSVHDFPPTLLVPVAFVIASLQHFLFLAYFDRFLTKRRVPYRY